MPVFESSIIIPVFNKWELTRNCLKRIAATTERDKTEVIVVDNASTDSTQSGCEFLGERLFGKSFRYIRNEENRNFAGASNQGAQAAQGEFLVFLNNDTEPQAGWLPPLIEDFTSFPDIAASGPLLIYPEETALGPLVQHLGILVNPFNKVGHLYEMIPAASPLTQKRRFFQAITAACMVIRRSCFHQIGGFDEDYINGFEDVDLCARLSAKGYRMTVNPDSTVVHLAGQSDGRHDHGDYNSLLLEEKSLHLLHPDWDTLLEADGLLLESTRWLKLRVAMPEVPQYGEVERLSDDQLLAAIVQTPYWEEGWHEILRRPLAERGRMHLVKACLRFFPDPENVLKLIEMPWVKKQKGLLTSLRARLQSYVQPPSSYLQAAFANLKVAREMKRGLISEQLNSFIERYGFFRDTDLPELAKTVWNLDAELGIAHHPHNVAAYTTWRLGIDASSRKELLSSFMNDLDQDYGPRISILMPVYNPDPAHLRAALDSLLAQSYPGWELCIADDASTDPETMRIIREYAEKDTRIRFISRAKNGHIAAATNTALEMAKYPWVALMDQDDMLTPDALAFIAQAISENPDASLFFSDEDKFKEGDLTEPYFKNGKWDWELLPVQNYVCHLAVYKTEKLRAIGGLREGYPGAQDHDLVLRYCANDDPRNFIHIPHVLYHWRVHAGSTAAGLLAKPYAVESADRAATDWLHAHVPGAEIAPLPRCAWTRIRYPVPSPFPSISLICPVSDPSFPLSDYCLAWGRNSTDVELIFSCRERDCEKLSAMLSQFDKDLNIRLVVAPDDYSSAQLAQIGAKDAESDIFGFIDSHLLPENDEFLAEIVSCLWRPDVGAVGGKIITDAGAMIHGGYQTDCSGSLKRIFPGHKPDAPTWFGWTRLARTVDALDSICLFTRKADFSKTGGFDVGMAEWAGQDYCLRLGEAALRSVWWPHALSRLRASRFRLTEAPQRFNERWRGRLMPFNENILAEKKGFSLCGAQRVS